MITDKQIEELGWTLDVELTERSTRYKYVRNGYLMVYNSETGRCRIADSELNQLIDCRIRDKEELISEMKRIGIK